MIDSRFAVLENEREYLRELAVKQMEYANLPVMAEREDLWRQHNALNGARPIVAFDINSFIGDLLPPLRCESETARAIERSLLAQIVNHERIGDDKVVPGFFTVTRKIDLLEFGLNYNVKRVPDRDGRSLGYHIEETINDLEEDFAKLKPSIMNLDAAYTSEMTDIVQYAIGDIIPVVVKNQSLNWSLGLSAKIVNLMGMENMMLCFYDCPDKLRELYEFITNETIRYVKWQESEGLLTLNNHNDYAGAGSWGFTDELPKSADGIVRTNDLWGNINSQETLSISPEMYHEFCFPYYSRIAELFGLVYYGCCEPVHPIWENSVSKYPNLRKVSVSAWCNEEYMGEVLRNCSVIYSRKPSPNYIGVGNAFDEDGFSAHIEKTLKAARGCKLELLFRDIQTLNGDICKPGRAMKIVGNLIDKLWQ